MTQDEFDARFRAVSDFRERVMIVTRQIPPGRVATYGQIAFLVGSYGGARAVGQALRSSVFTQDDPLPWQRVINAQGAISSRGDVERANLQQTLLEAEGIVFDARGRCDLARLEWSPTLTFWPSEL